MNRKISKWRPSRSLWKFSSSKLKGKLKGLKFNLKKSMVTTMEENIPRRRPRTRGLKRDLKLEREKEAQLASQLTLNEQFGIVMNENREYWLERSNNHLEDLLDKANRNT